MTFNTKDESDNFKEWQPDMLNTLKQEITNYKIQIFDNSYRGPIEDLQRTYRGRIEKITRGSPVDNT